MKTPLTGGCMCGAARYRVSGEPLTVVACHCTDCQKRSGSSFAITMAVLSAAFTCQGEDLVDFDITMPDGRVKRGRFCGKCGTRVWTRPEILDQLVLVPAGTLDDPTVAEPVAHLWTRSAQPWVEIPEGVPTFETQPDDPRVLIRLGNERARASAEASR